ncbi:helix-turn-helix domain-containing protein [Pseudoxanthomonas japonensis]|nr:helix-turn-helix domain-containing protein [Pseudoxanthomonas japonensis]
MPRDAASDLPPSAYREVAPAAPLRAGLACAWTYQAPSRPAAEVLVIPDGCVDLIWTDDEVFVAGPDPIAQTASIAPGALLTAIRFAPGAAQAFLGLPLRNVTGQRVALRNLWGRRARRLTDGLAFDAADPTDRLRSLQHAVARQGLPTADPAMRALFTRLAHSDAASPARLARELGIGERTLRRRCHDAFGYGPKTLARILRLQRFLRTPADLPLLRRALDAGYGDASHLVRDTRLLTGLTPTDLLAQRHG